MGVTDITFAVAARAPSGAQPPLQLHVCVYAEARRNVPSSSPPEWGGGGLLRDSFAIIQIVYSAGVR